MSPLQMPAALQELGKLETTKKAVILNLTVKNEINAASVAKTNQKRVV